MTLLLLSLVGLLVGILLDRTGGLLGAVLIVGGLLPDSPFKDRLHSLSLVTVIRFPLALDRSEPVLATNRWKRWVAIGPTA